MGVWGLKQAFQAHNLSLSYCRGSHLVSCSVLVVNLELVNENREWTHVRAILLICSSFNISKKDNLENNVNRTGESLGDLKH